LSVPTLPTFHSVSDAALVAKYRAERVKDPREFDKKTAEINKALTTAKIRGGSNSLTQGDYTVELASREDTAKVEKWRNVERSLDRIHKNEDSSREKGEGKTKKRSNRKRRHQGMGAGNSDVGIRANFDLAENVVKYTTSGYMRLQCTRQVEDGKTTYTTWIEINHEVFVPSERMLSGRMHLWRSSRPK